MIFFFFFFMADVSVRAAGSSPVRLSSGNPPVSPFDAPGGSRESFATELASPHDPPPAPSGSAALTTTNPSQGYFSTSESGEAASSLWTQTPPPNPQPPALLTLQAYNPKPYSPHLHAVLRRGITLVRSGVPCSADSKSCMTCVHCPQPSAHSPPSTVP